MTDIDNEDKTSAIGRLSGDDREIYKELNPVSFGVLGVAGRIELSANRATNGRWTSEGNGVLAMVALTSTGTRIIGRSVRPDDALLIKTLQPTTCRALAAHLRSTYWLLEDISKWLAILQMKGMNNELVGLPVDITQARIDKARRIFLDPRAMETVERAPSESNIPIERADLATGAWIDDALRNMPNYQPEAGWQHSVLSEINKEHRRNLVTRAIDKRNIERRTSELADKLTLASIENEELRQQAGQLTRWHNEAKAEVARLERLGTDVKKDAVAEAQVQNQRIVEAMAIAQREMAAENATLRIANAELAEKSGQFDRQLAEHRKADCERYVEDMKRASDQVTSANRKVSALQVELAEARRMLSTRDQA